MDANISVSHQVSQIKICNRYYKFTTPNAKSFPIEVYAQVEQELCEVVFELCNLEIGLTWAINCINRAKSNRR